MDIATELTEADIFDRLRQEKERNLEAIKNWDDWYKNIIAYWRKPRNKKQHMLLVLRIGIAAHNYGKRFNYILFNKNYNPYATGSDYDIVSTMLFDRSLLLLEDDKIIERFKNAENILLTKDAFDGSK